MLSFEEGNQSQRERLSRYSHSVRSETFLLNTDVRLHVASSHVNLEGLDINGEVNKI